MKKGESNTSRKEAALRRFHEEGQVERTYDLKLLARIGPYIRPEAKRLAGSIALLVISASASLARPLVMRTALDGLTAAFSGSAIVTTGLLLGGLLLFEQALAFPQVVLMQTAGARAMAALRKDVFRVLHTRSLSFFDRTPLGRLVTRATSDVDAIGEMFASGALNAIGDLIKLVVIVVVLVGIHPKLAAVAFLAVPPMALFVEYVRRGLRDAYREVRTKTARMNAQLSEQVSGMAIVQAYAQEARCAEEFDEVNRAYYRANNRAIVFDSTLDATTEMVSSVCVAVILWFAGGETLRGGTTFGTLFAFVAYVEMFFMPLRDLSTRYTLLQSALAGAERVFELLDNRETDSRAKEELPPAPPADGSAPAILFQNIEFGYKPDHPVLRAVSFEARAGELVAIVGATGAGKSTILSLLLRLYDPGAGDIQIFGRPLRRLDRKTLGSTFAVVPQDVFLFSGTLASNIASGEEPDLDRVRRALHRVGCLEWFERRPGGLEASVAERGSNFSLGERQLIAFARAMYKEAPILVLDEPTASIDSDTEARLQRALEGATEGRTVMVVAHRLSTIRRATRILVCHRGQLVEQGTHEDLMARDGVYAKLYRLQFEKRHARSSASHGSEAAALATTSK